MTTHTLTGKILDFGDAPAKVTGTITAGGLVDGAWVALPSYATVDGVHVASVEVAVDSSGNLTRKGGGPVVLEESLGFGYRLTLRGSGKTVVFHFVLTADLDLKDVPLASPTIPPLSLGEPVAATGIDLGTQHGTITLSANAGLQEVTIDGAATITPPANAPVSSVIALRIHQDATGGHVVLLDPAIAVEGGTWEMPTTAGVAETVVLTYWPSSGWVATVATPVPVVVDGVGPTAGTLAASAITGTAFTLTVTGAADETSLHATPFAFSTDGGTTWSAWQEGATYAATGLTGTTTYSARHKVRDAAGNITTGAAISVTTDVQTIANPGDLGAALAWFDASDAAKVTKSGSDVTGITASAGAYPWSYSVDTGPVGVVTVNGRQALDLSRPNGKLRAMVGGNSTTAPVGPSIPSGVTRPWSAYVVLRIDTAGTGVVLGDNTQMSWQPNGAIFANGGGIIVEPNEYARGEVFMLTFVATPTASDPGIKLYRGPQLWKWRQATAPDLFEAVSHGPNYIYVGNGTNNNGAVLCEWGYFSKALTANEIGQLQAYAAQKWGAQ